MIERGLKMSVRSPMKHANRRTFLGGVGAAAAIAALPAGGHAQTAPAPVTLTLGLVPSDPDTPIVYGEKAGIFAKYGLNLQLTRVTSAPTIISAMLAGTLDFGKSSITTLLDAHEKGLPITLVAGTVVQNPKAEVGAFLLRKDSPIRTGADFNNQIVGLGALGGIGHIAILKWIDEHGGDWKSVKFVEVSFGLAAAAVERGYVVASECVEPMVSAALETGKIRLGARMYDALGSDVLIGVWATTKEFSAKHPELIHAFARAWRESATYTNAHHSQTVDMMAEFTGISAAVVAKMPRTTAGPTIVPSQIQPVIEASVKYGALNHRFPADDLIDPNIH